jgi:transposase-like protein
LAFLERLRWSEGFSCPQCQGRRAWRIASGHLKCAACSLKTSVTAGTIFDKTRSPLTSWFAAVWYVTSQKNGVSALGLQRVLGLGSYETAWVWLHKLRRAMVRPGRDRLRGEVEVDECYVGGVEEGGIGRRHAGDKAIVVIAVERQGSRLGRVRMRRIPDVAAATLIPFVQETVEPGSTVFTDAWSGYKRLAAAGYDHQAVSIRASGDPAHVALPNVHLVVGLLKRWIIGTHQGAPTAKHLDYYLDEFTFRFNRRRSARRGLLFYRLLQQAVDTPPAPLKQVLGGRPEINP